MIALQLISLVQTPSPAAVEFTRTGGLADRSVLPLGPG